MLRVVCRLFLGFSFCSPYLCGCCFVVERLLLYYCLLLYGVWPWLLVGCLLLLVGRGVSLLFLFDVCCCLLIVTNVC